MRLERWGGVASCVFDCAFVRDCHCRAKGLACSSNCRDTSWSNLPVTAAQRSACVTSGTGTTSNSSSPSSMPAFATRNKSCHKKRRARSSSLLSAHSMGFPCSSQQMHKKTRRLRRPIRRYKNHSGRTGGTKRMERSIAWNCGSDSRPFFRSRPLDIKNASTSASNTRLRHTWRIFPGGGAEMKGATTSRASSACCAFTAPATAALQCARRAVVRRTGRTHLTAA